MRKGLTADQATMPQSSGYNGETNEIRSPSDNVACTLSEDEVSIRSGGSYGRQRDPGST
jgi:hypothetical protein